MIIVPVKEGENIEKALKKFKRKFEKTASRWSTPFTYSSFVPTRNKKSSPKIWWFQNLFVNSYPKSH